MTQSKSSGTQNSHASNNKTEADKKGMAAQSKSSENEKSRIKAGSTEGAGGGAKQKQKH